MTLLDRPGLRVLPTLAVLALGCSVGDTGESFTGGSLTFGGGNTSAEAGGPDADTADESQGDDSATSGMTSGNDCTPSEEICNGQDDDCDGAIDNGDPGGGEACDTGMPGVCATGTSVCEAGAIACVPDTAASPELCDGLDNDCNGQVDDGDPDAGGACNTGMPGVCADGTGSCAGGSLECVPDVAPSAESCDGLDNDCNGQVDDGNPGSGGACNTGMPGICGVGTQQCSGGALSCQQNQMAAPDEICSNGLDDDCNGAVDDGCSTCAHDICVTGIALTPGCDPCVNTVCGADPFCCSNSWDLLCVDAVTSLCGIPC